VKQQAKKIYIDNLVKQNPNWYFNYCLNYKLILGIFICNELLVTKLV